MSDSNKVTNIHSRRGRIEDRDLDPESFIDAVSKIARINRVTGNSLNIITGVVKTEYGFVNVEIVPVPDRSLTEVEPEERIKITEDTLKVLRDLSPNPITEVVNVYYDTLEKDERVDKTLVYVAKTGEDEAAKLIMMGDINDPKALFKMTLTRA